MEHEKADIRKKMQYILNMRPVFNKEALFSDGTEYYRTPAEPKAGDTVTIRFRTQRYNVDSVYLVSQDQRVQMEICGTENGFDYYSAQVVIGEDIFRYYFEIQYGWVTCYYNNLGVCMKRESRMDFEIYPGFDTPKWAKGAVMYQIYVDRFLNGDPTNDVVTGEYHYIGDKSVQVEQWNKVPAVMGVREFYGGDLQGIMNKLDYLQDLGIEVIYLNPIFVSPSNHKYDCQDYDYVDPHYGRIVEDCDEGILLDGDSDNSHAWKYIKRVTNKKNLEASNELFAKLTAEIHRRGMKIILDGVFNHCGSFNKWMDRERIYEKQTGDIACDHIHRFKEDVAIMKKMGLKAYRFSMDWSRLLPEGTGRVNEAGVKFYSDLIDELLANGVEPFITMYHWELPYELYKKGGWLNRDIAEWFGEYAKLIAERFSDRVKYFFTLNEPQCFVGLGYLRGEHAPGVKAPLRDTFEMAHNALRAHGRAVQMLRAYAKQPIEVGFAPTCGMCYPESEKPEDIEAARQMMFSMSLQPADNWTWNVAWWSDPVLLGHYPEEGLRLYEQYLPKITDEDMKLIHEPLDIYGQNIYNGRCFRMGPDGRPQEVARPLGAPKTAVDWPVTPECIYWGLKYLDERYHMPMYLTENGMACHDCISLDGKVHDPNRIDFLARYLHQVKRAASEMDLRGYFEWTLLDNFEWNKGYAERFGLVYVDFATQKRIWKDSAYWYAQVVKDNGATI